MFPPDSLAETNGRRVNAEYRVMDGLTVTQCIRTFESEHGREPISIPAFSGSDDLRALIPKYLKARRKELEQLASLLDEREFGQIRAIADNLKDTGAAYGFPKLTTLGGAMQLAAEATDFTMPDRQFVELTDYVGSCTG
jgi:hypothetical protein